MKCFEYVREGNLEMVQLYITSGGLISQELLNEAIVYGKETGNYDIYLCLYYSCDCATANLIHHIGDLSV